MAHTTPKGYTLLRSFVGGVNNPAIVEKTDQEIVAAVLKDLSSVMEINEEPIFHKITRWRQSMPQYLVGHTFQIAKLKEDAARSLPGLHLAGAAYHGVGLPDCIDQGEAAAAKILKEQSVH